MNPEFPTNSPDYESTVLGCLMSATGTEMIEEFAFKYRDAAHYFYDLRNTEIFNAIMSLHASTTPVSSITVKQALLEKGNFESVGGWNYLSECLDFSEKAGTPENYQHYADTLQDLYRRRRVIKVAAQIHTDTCSDKPLAEVLTEAGIRLLSLSGDAGTDDTHDIGVVADQILKDAKERLEHEGTLSGLSTGFHGIDSLTNGLQPGELFVIAGRTSSGKTALAMNIAEHVAGECKIPVGVFSLEMTAKEITNRLICSNARVDSQDLKTMRLGATDLQQFQNAVSLIGKCPLHINDASGMTIDQIQLRARLMKRKHKVRLIIVDYIQLIGGGGGFKENRTTEVGRVTKGLKAMAKELGIPVLALSQFNRDCEKEQRPPELRDLRESGSIEQDANLVGLLYAVPGQKGKSDPLPYILKVDKNRNGPTGDVALVFHKTLTRFESEPL